MIKNLITDLAYEKITLSQALTRAKIISFKIGNEEFKRWIVNELNGYESRLEAPQYRVVEAEMVAKVSTFHGEQEAQISVDEKFQIDPYTWYILEGVAEIENVLKKDVSSNFIYIQMSPKFTEELSPLIQFPPGCVLKSLYKKVGISLYYRVISQTKQRLLDTLLQLDSTFPNLENDFNPITMEKDVRQIINNHIYGSNNNTNVGVGEKVEQTQNITINQNTISEIAEHLKTLKVPSEEIAVFEEIANEPVSKESKSQKLLNWVGEVAKKAIEKGIDLQIPAIIDLIQRAL